MAERVYQLFGRQMLDEMIEIPPVSAPIRAAITEAGAGRGRSAPRRLSVRGFVSRPEVQRANRNGIYVFVNRRLVRDRLLLHAIHEAYRNILPARRVSRWRCCSSICPARRWTSTSIRRKSRCVSGIRNSCTISRGIRCARRLAARGPCRALPRPAGRALAGASAAGQGLAGAAPLRLPAAAAVGADGARRAR